MTVDTRNSPGLPSGTLTTVLAHPRLTAIPAFSDNYIWALSAANGNRCLVVDPGDGEVVKRWLDAQQLTLTAILVTHHHPDHTAGIRLLSGAAVTVFGPRHEPIDGVHVLLGEGDTVTPDGIGTTFTVLDVPGHTRGHIAYHGVLEAGPGTETPLLFCGDTLFSAGCGRLFEGTAEQMHASLSRLAALRSDTLVCCAHEYTLGNLRFAAAVEPGNDDITAMVDWARGRRDVHASTLPSSIARELRINPFLRTQQPGVIEAAVQEGCHGDTAADVFATLRRWKDGFR